MQLSRRSFLKYCGSAAAMLGLSRAELRALADTLRGPGDPVVLWIAGAGCSGCSVSLLNHVSTSAPNDIADVLIDVIDLQYHPTLMAAAGDQAVSVLARAYEAGGYVLVVEGGVPTAFGGHACMPWSENGEEVTFYDAVVQLGARAAHVVCVGQCAAYGGIPAAGSNPTGILPVSTVLGRTTINVAGCPPHPDWMVATLARLLAGQTVTLDAFGRPTTIFSERVHPRCPYRNAQDATTFGQADRCLENLGCRGRTTYGPCPTQLFNGVNWCSGSGSPCIGCTSADFPADAAFFIHGG